MTNADLRCADEAFAAVGEFAVGGEVVVDAAARDKLFESGGDFFHIESGDKAKLHQGVGADVATASAAARLFRVGPPLGLHLARVFEFIGKPSLHVIGIDPAHFTEESATDDMAGEPARPVTEVGVGDGEGYVFLFGFGDEEVGLLEVDGEWFFTHHGDAELERFHGGVEVDEVWSDDEDVVDALIFGEISLGFEEGIVGFVADDRVGPVGGFVHGDFRVVVEGDGVNATSAIEVDSFLVGIGDEGSASSADHGDFKWLW